MLDFLRARRRALLVAVASAATVVLVSCGGGSEDLPPLFSKMQAFGGSTTDNGNACILSASNCPPSPPYAQGIYSNGPLWVTQVGASLGASAVPSRQGGTDWAYAFARTGAVPGVTTPASVPSMVAQVQTYLASYGFVSNPNYLYVVDGITVGNNIVDALTLSATNPNAPAAVITQAVTDMATMILQLYASGARHILVTNSTNVGRTPLARAAGPVAAAGATQMSAQFNAALAQQIAGLKATQPGLNIYLVDVYALSEQVFANPSAYGFTNVTDPCFNSAVNPPTVCANPSQYVYWDSFHSTTAGYALVAQRALAAMGR
jgi:phospholipase/lecithinase/hemolysin